MNFKHVIIGVSALMAASFVANADPLGAASAFNLLAIGSNTLAGNVNTSADVTGRIAAANMVGTGTTVASNIEDPYSSPNNYSIVSPAGFNAGSTFNLNSNGNVYAPGTNGNINFNGGGTRVTSGSSPIDFNALRTYLQNYSVQLGQLAANGSVGAATDPHNPSNLELYGANAQLDIFNVTAAQLSDSNHPLDIVTPTGATVLVNVLGAQSFTLSSALYYQGNQNSGDSLTDDKILFNFPTATAVTVNGQFSASILAPYALLSGGAQMDGNFIAAQIGQTGEVHDALFQGTLPAYQTAAATPEPTSLAMVALGIASVVFGVSRRKKSA